MKKYTGIVSFLFLFGLVTPASFAATGYEIQNAPATQETPQQGTPPNAGGVTVIQPGGVTVVPGAPVVPGTTVVPGQSGTVIVPGVAPETGVVPGVVPETGVVPGTVVTPQGSPNQELPPAAGVITPLEPTPSGKAPVVETPVIVPNEPVSPSKEPAPNTVVVPPVTTQTPEPAKTPEQPAQLWQLLPLQPETPEKTPEAKKPEPKKPEAVKPEKAEKPEAKKPEPKKPEPKKPEQAPEPKKPEQPEKTEKPKVGDRLRIPPESVKTGSTAFLEGCWQGTRPEYGSKRTIKECFCFGKDGGQGKRFINDFTQGRTCTGSTNAVLTGNGVLTMNSEGAYCSDGVRWGSAEMVCQGSGQKTPCSWVFQDANGGQQSYEIEFIRVNSCGR